MTVYNFCAGAKSIGSFYEANDSIIYEAGFRCLLDNKLKLKLFLEMRLCENPLFLQLKSQLLFYGRALRAEKANGAHCKHSDCSITGCIQKHQPDAL